MRQAKARILVVEDDPAILTGLLDVLVFNGYEAEGVADGGLGLEKALSQPFDLALLDVMLPTLDGFAICRALRKKKPTMGIVMLTAKGAEDDIVTGLKAGADDYIGKPFSLRELMVRIEAVLRRTGKSIGDEQITLLGVLFDGKTLTATYQQRAIELTRREMDILLYFQRHPDRIVTKKELLLHVWHYADADIETRTVDIHILKLRKKLAEFLGDKQLLSTVRGEGYRLEAAP